MRKTILTSVCAAAIALCAVAVASAQTSNDAKPAGAPANNQTNVTGPASTDGSMNAMDKTTKKKKSKMKKTDDSGMEKK
jgi:hypothetical protein